MLCHLAFCSALISTAWLQATLLVQMGVAEKASFVQKGTGLSVRSPALALQVPIALCLFVQLVVAMLQLAGNAQPDRRRSERSRLADQIENAVEVGTGPYEIGAGRLDTVLE
jgi:hypothetical protein